MRHGASLDSVASVLDGLAHRLGLESKLCECRLRRQWADIVGEHIAAHTAPNEIRSKKLIIHVRHSVWLQQLTFLKPALLEKIHLVAGSRAVCDLILRIGEVSDRAADGAPGSATGSIAAYEPPPQLKAQAAHHAQAVKDVVLREHLAMVMAQAIVRSLPTGGRERGSTP